MSSTIPESFAHIGSATLESIRFQLQDLPPLCNPLPEPAALIIHELHVGVWDILLPLETVDAPDQMFRSLLIHWRENLSPTVRESTLLNYEPSLEIETRIDSLQGGCKSKKNILKFTN